MSEWQSKERKRTPCGRPVVAQLTSPRRLGCAMVLGIATTYNYLKAVRQCPGTIGSVSLEILFKYLTQRDNVARVNVDPP